MKFAILLICFLVAVERGSTAAAARHRLRSDVQYSEGNHKAGRYKYGYAVKQGESQFHHQRSLDGAMYGCYGYVDPQGKLFITHYLADMAGYRLVNIANPDKKLLQRISQLGSADHPLELQELFPVECQADGDIKTLEQTAAQMRISMSSSTEGAFNSDANVQHLSASRSSSTFVSGESTKTETSQLTSGVVSKSTSTEAAHNDSSQSVKSSSTVESASVIEQENGQQSQLHKKTAEKVVVQQQQKTTQTKQIYNAGYRGVPANRVGNVDKIGPDGSGYIRVTVVDASNRRVTVPQRNRNPVVNNLVGGKVVQGVAGPSQVNSVVMGTRQENKEVNLNTLTDKPFGKLESDSQISETATSGSSTAAMQTTQSGTSVKTSAVDSIQVNSAVSQTVSGTKTVTVNTALDKSSSKLQGSLQHTQISAGELPSSSTLANGSKYVKTSTVDSSSGVMQDVGIVSGSSVKSTVEGSSSKVVKSDVSGKNEFSVNTAVDESVASNTQSVKTGVVEVEETVKDVSGKNEFSVNTAVDGSVVSNTQSVKTGVVEIEETVKDVSGKNEFSVNTAVDGSVVSNMHSIKAGVAEVKETVKVLDESSDGMKTGTQSAKATAEVNLSAAVAQQTETNSGIAIKSTSEDTSDKVEGTVSSGFIASEEASSKDVKDHSSVKITTDEVDLKVIGSSSTTDATKITKLSGKLQGALEESDESTANSSADESDNGFQILKTSDIDSSILVEDIADHPSSELSIEIVADQSVQGSADEGVQMNDKVVEVKTAVEKDSSMMQTVKEAESTKHATGYEKQISVAAVSQESAVMKSDNNVNVGTLDVKASNEEFLKTESQIVEDNKEVMKSETTSDTASQGLTVKSTKDFGLTSAIKSTKTLDEGSPQKTDSLKITSETKEHSVSAADTLTKTVYAAVKAAEAAIETANINQHLLFRHVYGQQQNGFVKSTEVTMDQTVEGSLQKTEEASGMTNSVGSFKTGVVDSSMKMSEDVKGAIETTKQETGAAFRGNVRYKDYANAASKAAVDEANQSNVMSTKVSRVAVVGSARHSSHSARSENTLVQDVKIGGSSSTKNKVMSAESQQPLVNYAFNTRMKQAVRRPLESKITSIANFGASSKTTVVEDFAKKTSEVASVSSTAEHSSESKDTQKDYEYQSDEFSDESYEVSSQRAISMKLPATPRATTEEDPDVVTVSYEISSGTDRVPVTPHPTTGYRPPLPQFLPLTTTTTKPTVRGDLGTTIGPSGDVYDEIEEDPEVPIAAVSQPRPSNPSTSVSSGSNIEVLPSVSSPCYEVILQVPTDAKQVIIKTDAPSFRVHGEGDPEDRIKLLEEGVYEVNVGAVSGIQFQQYQHKEANKLKLNLGKNFNYGELVPKPLNSVANQQVAGQNNPYLPLVPVAVPAAMEARRVNTHEFVAITDGDQALTNEQRALLSLIPSWKKVLLYI